MLFVNRSRTALLLVTLMLLSSILPGCIESVEELEEDNPNAAPKEAMGMWWPTVDGIIETPTVSPTTEWSDAHKVDIEFEDEAGGKHAAKLTYKSVEEGMAIAVEMDELKESPRSVSWNLPDRVLQVNPDIVGGTIDSSLKVEGISIDTSSPMDLELLGIVGMNQIAAIYDISSKDFVLESYAKFLFEDTTSVNYTIVAEFEESTWTYEMMIDFDWVLPFLFPRSDISITGIEVTQATQTADMQIPLVEGKTSLARVYVDSGSLTTANVEVTLKFCFLIFCFDELKKNHVAVKNPDRTNIDESANFILPDHWVTYEGIDGPIPIGLIASIKPIYPTGSIDYVDPDNSNNYLSGVFELHQTHDLRIAVMPNVNSVSSDMQNMMDYWMEMTEAVFPVANVEVIYWPATSTSVTGSGSNLNDWLRGSDLFTSILILAFGGEVTWDQVHAVTSSGGGASDPMWYGDSDGDGDEEYLTGGVANPGRTSRVSYCGPSATSRELCTAHEITHNIGPANWDGDGDGFDADGLDEDWGKHLYASCPGGSTDDQVWVNQFGGSENQSNILDLGWNPITPNPETNQNSLIPSSYPDYMSYCMAGPTSSSISDATTGPPWNLPYTTNLTKWVSTYRYLELFEDFTEWYEDGSPPDYYTSTLGSSDSGARQQQQQTIRYVRGVAPHDGTPSLKHSWTIDGKLPAFAMERGDDLDHWDLRVIVRDSNGNTLDSATYEPHFHVHESVNEEEDDHFTFFFQDDGLIHSIELQNSSGHTIDSLYSSGMPTTRFSPLDSTEFNRDRPTSVSWTRASSSSNLEVLYQLEYSWKPGLWMPIGEMTNSTSMSIDFTTYPGGTNDSKLRVRATNGFDTYYSESSSFALPNQAPELTLETSGARGVQIDSSRARIVVQGESFSVTPEIRDDDWTSINENGCTAVLKRGKETVWSHGDTAETETVREKNRITSHPSESLEKDDNRQGDRQGTTSLMHDSVHCLHNNGAFLPYSFPNKDLLPGEMIPGDYVFEMRYTDVGGASVTETVSFSIIVPDYLVGPDSTSTTEEVLQEYRSKLEMMSNISKMNNDLSRDELQYYVELARVARGEDDALSDVEIGTLQEYYGISDSRAKELRDMANSVTTDPWDKNSDDSIEDTGTDER